MSRFFAMDLQSILEASGSTSFDFADSHADAVAAAMARRPAVITSDVRLFEGYGPEAVAEIRARLGYIPSIFVTATPQDCKVMLDGDVLTKSINRDALRNRFRRVCS